MLLKEVFIPKTHSWKLFENEGKNTHLEHIEDLVFNNGYDGAVRAFEYLDAVKGLLEGGSPTGKLTVKWDGAPAIICGIELISSKVFPCTTRSKQNETCTFLFLDWLRWLLNHSVVPGETVDLSIIKDPFDI